MRVTGNTFSNSLASQLGYLTAQQAKLQTQVSTGQRIQSPEDDPAALRRVMDLQSNARSLAQYQQNQVHQKDVATLSYGAIQSLKKVSDRANEIATLADGLKSPNELKAYANEIDGMIQLGLQAANRKQGNNYLFGGTQTSQAPFVAAMDASGNVTAVEYHGNSDQALTEIAEGVTLSAQVPGANSDPNNVRGLITDAGSGADLFSHLISLRQHLLAGDTAAIASTDRAQLAQDEDNVVYHLSANGATQARLESMAASSADQSQNFTRQVSEETGVDIAATIVQLTQAQSTYQAALQSGAKILTMSLMDYLR